MDHLESVILNLPKTLGLKHLRSRRGLQQLQSYSWIDANFLNLILALLPISNIGLHRTGR